MYKHHEESIKIITDKLKNDENILAVLVGGSIAHGCELEDSDIDLMIVISSQEYQNRLKEGTLSFFDKESCTYGAGYIEGKYISVDFIKAVAEKGSEAWRYAFTSALIAYSKIDGLDQLINEAQRYPSEYREDRIKRFYAQFQAWKWYCDEALKRNNKYLLNYSISNLVLFGGRLILAFNETLYPYHKWFLKVLDNVRNKPDNILGNIESVLNTQGKEEIERFYNCINEFIQWDTSGDWWPNVFAQDSELTWLKGNTPIAEL